MSSFNYITHTYPILDPAPLEQTRIFSGENPLVEPPAGEYYENYIGYINLEADSVIRRFDCGISHAPRGKVVPDRSCDRLLIKVLL